MSIAFRAGSIEAAEAELDRPEGTHRGVKRKVAAVAAGPRPLPAAERKAARRWLPGSIEAAEEELEQEQEHTHCYE